MTLSLDTLVFLWWLDDPRQLSKAARKAIGDGGNTVYVSAAVVWEIAIKRALGKLDAPDDVEAAMKPPTASLPLPITIPHAPGRGSRAAGPPSRNPFDRLLIAQALHEGFTFVTRDRHVRTTAFPPSSPEDASARTRDLVPTALSQTVPGSILDLQAEGPATRPAGGSGRIVFPDSRDPY